MITQFILIVVFAHSYGPRSNFTTLGEYNTMAACQASASATFKATKELDLAGSNTPKFVCAAKGSL